MAFKLIDKKLIIEGWAGPFHFRFLFPFILFSAFTYVSVILLYSLFLYLLFYDGAYDYWVFALNFTLSLITLVLIEIPIYKAFHRLNYLHYCKTMLAGQVVVVGYYIFFLFWSCTWL